MIMCIWTAASKHVNKSSTDTLQAPSSHNISKCLDRANQACQQEHDHSPGHDHLQICVD